MLDGLVSIILVSMISLIVRVVWQIIQTKNELSTIKRKKIKLKRAARLHQMTSKEKENSRKKRIIWNRKQNQLIKKLAWLQLTVYILGIAVVVISLAFFANRLQAKTPEKISSAKIITILDTVESPLKAVAEPTKEADTEVAQVLHPFNKTVEFPTTFLDLATMTFFAAKLEVTVLTTTRGADCWDLLVAENQFNKPPPSGKEYIMNRVRIKVLDSKEPHPTIKLSSFDFSYISTSGQKYERCILIAPDTLPNEIAANTDVEGNIYSLIDQGDQPHISVQDKEFMSIQ
ncbi:hypothetical protein ACWOFR_17825 [Carnobacterium gallinarum]|uniref:hypothetical protein n=1 Tax=Carnobacterium gallinarum TaxID=2749 RepID=UPI000550041D|nr:hypothetical protein [Carnobacterium gallinarum]